MSGISFAICVLLDRLFLEEFWRTPNMRKVLTRVRPENEEREAKARAVKVITATTEKESATATVAGR